MTNDLQVYVPPLVGLDSCIFVEAAKVPSGLCAIIVELATKGLFRVLLVPRVHYEVRKELGPAGLLPKYEEWLELSDVYACRPPTTREIRDSVPFLWPRVTHCPDYRVAVSVRTFTPRYFVTSNTKDRKDWKRSPELRAALGGTSVVVPKQYLMDLKQPVPRRGKWRADASGTSTTGNLFDEQGQ
jgi:hypothetical protein